MRTKFDEAVRKAYQKTIIEDLVKIDPSKKNPKFPNVRKSGEFDPSRTVFKNDKVEVIQINNKKDAIEYGKGTEWCLSDSFHDYYMKNYNIYFILSAGTGRPLGAILVDPSGKTEGFNTEDIPVKADRLMAMYDIPSSKF